jgi:hypothetical protein
VCRVYQAPKRSRSRFINLLALFAVRGSEFWVESFEVSGFRVSELRGLGVSEFRVSDLGARRLG